MRSASIWLAVAILATSGCRYSGGIYSYYQHVGLGVRAAPESGSPVDLNFGYDHSSVAFVPKRGGADSGEAVSILASNSLQANPKPLDPNAGAILQANAVFISGDAAVVATAPKDSTVTFAARGADARTATASEELTVRTQGDPGERVSAAFSAGALYPSRAHRTLQETEAEVRTRPNRGAVLDKAAQDIGGDFLGDYQATKSALGDDSEYSAWQKAKSNRETALRTANEDVAPLFASLARALDKALKALPAPTGNGR